MGNWKPELIKYQKLLSNVIGTFKATSFHHMRRTKKSVYKCIGNILLLYLRFAIIWSHAQLMWKLKISQLIITKSKKSQKGNLGTTISRPFWKIARIPRFWVPLTKKPSDDLHANFFWKEKHYINAHMVESYSDVWMMLKHLNCWAKFTTSLSVLYEWTYAGKEDFLTRILLVDYGKRLFSTCTSFIFVSTRR